MSHSSWKINKKKAPQQQCCANKKLSLEIWQHKDEKEVDYMNFIRPFIALSLCSSSSSSFKDICWTNEQSTEQRTFHDIKWKFSLIQFLVFPHTSISTSWTSSLHMYSLHNWESLCLWLFALTPISPNGVFFVSKRLDSKEEIVEDFGKFWNFWKGKLKVLSSFKAHFE